MKKLIISESKLNIKSFNHLIAFKYFVICIILFAFNSNLFSQLFSRKTVVLSEDNKQLYVVFDGVIVYNLEDMTISKVYSQKKNSVDVIDVRNNLLLYGNNSSFNVVDTKTDISRSFKLNSTDTKTYNVFLALNENNTKVYATWDGSKSVQIIDLNSENVISDAFSISDLIITRLEISPDRKTLASLCKNPTKGGAFLVIWDTQTMKLIKKISLSANCNCMAFNKESTELILALDYYDFKNESKFKIDWNGRIDTYPLCLQVFTVSNGKKVKEMPTEKNSIYSVSFDYGNPDIVYTSNKTFNLMSFDNKKRSFSKIGNSPGAGTCELTSYKDHLVASVGYETTIFETNNRNQNKKLYFENIKSFYFDNNGKKVNDAEKGKASLMFGISYKYNTLKPQWFIVNKEGLYDCEQKIDSRFQWMYFQDFKPLKKDTLLLSKLIKINEYSDLATSLAGILKDEKWTGLEVKGLFEYSSLNFEPYLDFFGMKRKEDIAPKVSTNFTGEDLWENACKTAKAQMIKDGLSIVAEKSGYANGLTATFNISQTSILNWYVLGNKLGTILEVSTPKGSEQVTLSKDGSNPLYFNSGKEKTGIGNYSFKLSDGERGYIIAGVKAQTTAQEDARRILESQGYDIVFDETKYAKPHYPIIANLDFGGNIAWIAFTDNTCGPIDVGVNGTSKGSSKTENGLTINSGSVFIEGNAMIMKAVPVSCGSSTTFIIGVK